MTTANEPPYILPRIAAGFSSDTWLTSESLERLERKWREALQRGESLVRFGLELDEELERNPSEFLDGEAHERRHIQVQWEREAADLLLVCRMNLGKHFGYCTFAD